MRILALRTYSLSCDPILQPIARLGHDLVEVVFWSPNTECPSFSTLPAIVDDAKPDLVIMLGQHDNKVGNCPPASVLAAIARRRPFAHICCDGSERVWWPQLEEYALVAPEMVHVNIDGVAAGFFAPQPGCVATRRWTTLCPMDHEPWEKVVAAQPWHLRSITLGFCGGWGEKHPRGPDIDRLVKGGLLKAALRPFYHYDHFRSFMCSFRAGYNHALTGTADHMHVKARVVETAFAGALLVEPEGSPTADWFDVGIDYLPYSSVDDLKIIHGWATESDGWLLEKADRMRRKAIDRYSAQRFWPKLFELVGL